MHARHVDYPLLAATLILVAAGLLAASSASIGVAQDNFGKPYYYLLHQGGAALVGLAALWISLRLPLALVRKLALPLFLISLALTAAVFVPGIGLAYNGAWRWLDLRSFSVQPSEMLKLSLILYLAHWMDRAKARRAGGLIAGLAPFLVVIGTPAILLVRQPDIGTLLIVAGSAVMLYFLGGSKPSQLAVLAVFAATALAVLIRVEPYRLNRLLVFWNPSLKPQSIGYHINQALIAIGSGGFWGRGFGQSIQKFSYLPESTGDSIFAVIVEEFGFLGGVILALLFLFFVLRGFAVARRAPDFFSKLLAAGLTASIALQAFINMAAISGLLPLTGVPLPFISYGGTSLVVTLAMAGLVLNISKQKHKLL